MRTLILGSSGNFGARIVRALEQDVTFDLVTPPHRGCGAAGPALDIDAPDFAGQLAACAPRLVIHCAGPFQRQDYRVARACIAAGTHYIDLADGRAFVEGFGPALDALARDGGVACISGASTLPALSSAVVDALAAPGLRIEAIDVVIAPGQRAPRGRATLQAVFDYLGQPFSTWDEGRWQTAWGWMDLQRVDVAGARRWSALCDVPDLALFPSRYPGVARVTFRAALEFASPHVVLWMLAAARRVGLPLDAPRIAMSLDRFAPWLSKRAGDHGGMSVVVTGMSATGRRVRRAWQVLARAEAGPEIPCFAAVLLARKLAAGLPLAPGARPCMGMLELADFAPLFAQWHMSTRVDEVAA